MDDMMKVARDILTLEAKVKQIKVQACKKVDRQNDKMKRLERLIAEVDGQVNAIFVRQKTLEQRFMNKIEASNCWVSNLEA